MKSVFGGWSQPQAVQHVQNPGPCTTFVEALLDLHHSSTPSGCCIDSQVAENVIVCRILRCEQQVELFADLFGAGDEACFVCVDGQTRNFEFSFERAER